MKDYANISYVNEALESLVHEVRREQREAIEDAVWKRSRMIEGLLTNGRPYLMQASGSRFDKIYQLRQRLWAKLDELMRVVGLICEA